MIDAVCARTWDIEAVASKPKIVLTGLDRTIYGYEFNYLMYLITYYLLLFIIFFIIFIDF